MYAYYKTLCNKFQIYALRFNNEWRQITVYIMTFKCSQDHYRFVCILLFIILLCYIMMSVDSPADTTHHTNLQGIWCKLILGIIFVILTYKNHSRMNEQKKCEVFTEEEGNKGSKVEHIMLYAWNHQISLMANKTNTLRSIYKLIVNCFWLWL